MTSLLSVAGKDLLGCCSACFSAWYFFNAPLSLYFMSV